MSTTELPSPISSGFTPPKQSASLGFDLLRLRPVKALVGWAGFPYLFQFALLALFVSLAIFGWGLYPPDGVPAKLYAKSNLVNLLVWGLWWPAIVWTAVLFGRVWCAICPLELVANITERIGRILGVEQRILGKWLRCGAFIVGLYALVQMLVAGASLHRIPAYTSLFLWGLLALAALTGFFFKDRAFCRGFCPVGLLLSTYGRGAMLAVRSPSSDSCSACIGKGCTHSENRTRLDSRSCPSLLNPARLDSSADCLVCGQCIKVCQPGNLGLYLRAPFSAADSREPLASWPVTLFVMLVSGFVTCELFSEWKSAQALFLWVPEEITKLLSLDSYAGWIEGVWTLFLYPAALWLVLGGVVLAFGGAGGLTEAWRRLAIPLAVVVAAGHMAKGLAKLVSWVGFLPLVAGDPAGIETSLAIHSKTLPQPGSILPMVAVSPVAMLLMLTAAWFACRELRLTHGESHRRLIAPVLTVAAGFLFLVFGWGFLQ